MNSLTRLALLLSLQLTAGAAFIACGGGDDDAADDDDTTEKDDAGNGTANQDAGSGGMQTANGGLGFVNAPLYSAFVEGQTAQVPVVIKEATMRGKGAKFKSSDESIATVEDTGEGALVTAKKEGTVTITGTLGDESGSVRVNIKKYTAEQWMQGQARYSKSDKAIVPPSGGTLNLLALQNGGTLNKSGACNTCHTPQAPTLKIENTPRQIAGYSDEDLVTIFTKGQKPTNAPRQSDIPPFAWGMFHSWEVSEAERPGLIAFLRTQPLRDNPAMIDYGVKMCSNPPPGCRFALCDSKTEMPVMIPGAPACLPADGGTPGGNDGGAASSDAGASDAGAFDAGSTADAGARDAS